MITYIQRDNSLNGLTAPGLTDVLLLEYMSCKKQPSVRPGAVRPGSGLITLHSFYVPLNRSLAGLRRGNVFSSMLQPDH